MAREISNRIRLSSKLGFELTGYIGRKSLNNFVKIDSSQIKVIASTEGWVVNFNISAPLEIKFGIQVKKTGNNVTFVMVPLDPQAKNLEDTFLTLLLRDYRTNLYYTVYHGHIKLFNTRYVELPAQITIGLEDFASSIANSIKEANKSISQRLENSPFELEIGDIEIKTPYVTQISSNNKLVMKMPQPSEKSNTDEPVFSKINFKNIPKLQKLI